METKNFTLIELLQTRVWLISLMNSTRTFSPVSSEQIKKAGNRLKEIEQALIDRIIEGIDPEPKHKVFQDESFEQTLEQLAKREE